MKNKIAALLIGFFCVVMMTGCMSPVKGKSYSYSILGIDSSYEFNKDGTVVFDTVLGSRQGTYTYEKEIITIEWKSGTKETLTYDKDSKAVVDYSGITYYLKK